ncbi:MAG: hypothetical protein FWE13_06535 [Firmicutes bacterium]|nr:hypothetical protein [Bacillota bacterium]
MTINDFLTEYQERGASRWHTPGHKGRLFLGDITELVDESFPECYIKNAEEKVAKFYGVKKLRFLTGGSSIGIKATILACGEDIIAFRGCHQAIEEGCELAKVKYCLYDVGIGDNGLPNLLTVESVKKAIEEFPMAKAVYIESPDYYGRVVAKEVAEVIKQSGKLFFCDGAHGAHFVANKILSSKRFETIADVTNLSAHKTLNALTGGAYLCINNEKLLGDIDKWLKNLGTTSPNYLILGSLEEAIENVMKNENMYQKLYDYVFDFRIDVPCLDDDYEESSPINIDNSDFTRLVVDAVELGYNSGKELTNHLAKNHNIFAEKHEGRWAVFIATPHETKEDFLKLTRAILPYKYPY